MSREIESFLESFNQLDVQDEKYKLKERSICRDGSDFELHKILQESKDKTNAKTFTQDSITEYLQASENLLLLCSKNAVKSEFVKFEVDCSDIYVFLGALQQDAKVSLPILINKLRNSNAYNDYEIVEVIGKIKISPEKSINALLDRMIEVSQP